MMKLASLFKFKRKKNDIDSLLKKIFDNVESDLFNEFQKDIYSWSKSDGVKRYECFAFSKFLINYSFSVSHNDIDKNVINSFNKMTDEIFSQLHEEKYLSVLDYKDMKNVLDQKYELFYSLRKDNKPPACWNLIYSSFTGKNTIDEVQIELLGLKKAVKSLRDKIGSEDLIYKFEDGINYKLKIIESFDLAEISFRQNIRAIKKQLSLIDIPKQLSSKK